MAGSAEKRAWPTPLKRGKRIELGPDEAAGSLHTEEAAGSLHTEAAAGSQPSTSVWVHAPQPSAHRPDTQKRHDDEPRVHEVAESRDFTVMWGGGFSAARERRRAACIQEGTMPFFQHPSLKKHAIGGGEPELDVCTQVDTAAATMWCE